MYVSHCNVRVLLSYRCTKLESIVRRHTRHKNVIVCLNMFTVIRLVAQSRPSMKGRLLFYFSFFFPSPTRLLIRLFRIHCIVRRLVHCFTKNETTLTYGLAGWFKLCLPWTSARIRKEVGIQGYKVSLLSFFTHP